MLRTTLSCPTRFRFLLLLLLLLLLTGIRPSEADAISDCFEALAFDGCTVIDQTGVCQERFQQDEFANATYSRQLFDELIELFLLSPTLNTTSSALLPLLLSPLDTTYSDYLDATYGTACSSDSGIAAILNGTLTEATAQISRLWLLLLMKQANFCTDNEMFVIGQGCVCKEDKDCNDGTGSAHVELIKRMAGMVLVLAFWVGWGIYTNHRQANAVGSQQDTVIQTSNILYAQSVSDSGAIVRVLPANAASSGEDRKSRASPPPSSSPLSHRPTSQSGGTAARARVSTAVPRAQTVASSPQQPQLQPAPQQPQQQRSQSDWTS